MTDEEQKIVFAENLRFYIDRTGKQQKEIAKDLHISTSTLNTWVKAKAIPNVAKIQVLANYFGVGMSALIDPHDNEQEAADREAAVLYHLLDSDDKTETREFMKFKLAGEKYDKKKSKKIS